MTSSRAQLCRMDDLAVLAVTGPDARAFLHAQLTQDIAGLPSDRGTLAAWCDARGRVRALFHLLQDDAGWLLITSFDLAPALIAQLRRYVLRAAVVISACHDLGVYALVGATSAVPLARQSGSVLNRDGVRWLRVDAGLAYAVGADAAVRATCPDCAAAPPTVAELAAIRAGLPAVDGSASESFIPQMLNLDTLGAVAFAKGCYPGQEIITRARNLGTVKRRLRRFSAAHARLPARGTALLGADATAVGQIIRAAPTGTAVEMLAVVPLDTLAATLRLDGQPGVSLDELPLPEPAQVTPPA